MTALSFVEELEIWSLAYLADQVFNNLACLDSYRDYTRALFHRITVKRQHAPYIVRQSDLSSRVIRELEACTPRGRRDALREAVLRLFEEIDYYYSRLSISPFLVVRIEP